FGADKYSWGGWANVEGGITRYGNALNRHQIDEAEGKFVDEETGAIQAVAVAWNALARAELILRQIEEERRLIDVTPAPAEEARPTIQEQIDRSFDVVADWTESPLEDDRCTFCGAGDGYLHT